MRFSLSFSAGSSAVPVAVVTPESASSPSPSASAPSGSGSGASVSQKDLDTASVCVLEAIRSGFWLVNVVDNDFVHGDLFAFMQQVGVGTYRVEREDEGTREREREVEGHTLTFNVVSCCVVVCMSCCRVVCSCFVLLCVCARVSVDAISIRSLTSRM